MSSLSLPYLVGVADVDVTPAIGTKLAGFAARTGDATGVYLPLRAIVTAITERATGFPADIHGFGRQLAAVVVREIHHGRLLPVAGLLQVRSRKLELHCTVLSRADYAAWLDSDNKFFARWAREHVSMLDRSERPATAVQFELHILQFGQSLVLVGMAGEMSAEYGLRLVRELGHRFGQVWPVGYANEIVGYVPSERQLPEGGYEVFTNMQYIGKPGPYASGTAERIFAAVREMLAAD